MIIRARFHEQIWNSWLVTVIHTRPSRWLMHDRDVPWLRTVSSMVLINNIVFTRSTVGIWTEGFYDEFLVVRLTDADFAVRSRDIAPLTNSYLEWDICYVRSNGAAGLHTLELPSLSSWWDLFASILIETTSIVVISDSVGKVNFARRKKTVDVLALLNSPNWRKWYIKKPNVRRN